MALAQGMVNTIWPYIGGRRGLIILAIGIAAGGMAMNWGWLEAVGAASILLAVLPCAAMCALGLCMNISGGKSCASGSKIPAEGAHSKGDPDPSA
ncbi:MAG: hypothetical protein O2967_06225 [Proteobacteria bacterium]|nr:hypothetical protein [Pseudomonadota bacterium]